MHCFARKVHSEAGLTLAEIAAQPAIKYETARKHFRPPLGVPAFESPDHGKRPIDFLISRESLGGNESDGPPPEVPTIPIIKPVVF